MAVLVSSCWYGPAEVHHRIEHVVRKPGEYISAAFVYTETVKPPRGLATFPNGGVSRLVESEFSIHAIVIDPADSRNLITAPVPEQVRHAFNAHFVGWEGDFIYLRFTGCPAVECWGHHVKALLYTVSESGEINRIKDLPESAKIKGQSLAPMPAERNYLRVGHTFDEITFITEAGAEPEPLFVLNKQNGHIVPAQR
jgi:hypothetical protein